jgi:hypothetical protein
MYNGITVTDIAYLSKNYCNTNIQVPTWIGARITPISNVPKAFLVGNKGMRCGMVPVAFLLTRFRPYGLNKSCLGSLPKGNQKALKGAAPRFCPRVCSIRFTGRQLYVHSQSILSACSFMGDCDSGPDVIRGVCGLLLVARGWNRGCVLIILHSCMAWHEVNRSQRCARLRSGFAAHVKSSAITNDKRTPPEFWHGFSFQHILVRLDELSLSVGTYTFFLFSVSVFLS